MHRLMFLFLISAHGHSANIIKCLKMVKEAFPDTLLLQEILQLLKLLKLLLQQVQMLLKLVSVPGSICTTRVVAGIGVPQITAVYDVACSSEI